MENQTKIEKRFAFGANWKRYVRTIGETEIEAAKASLAPAIQGMDISSATFLDIGCGSGLFSRAAAELGFARVISFDYDKNSVAATLELRAAAPVHADRWTVMQGSVLDENFMKELGQHTVVYSWGVLHHTGAMWQAIDLAMKAVAPGGRFYIALYNDQGIVSRYWTAVKWLYVSSPLPVRFLMLLFYWTYFGLGLALADLVRFRNPLQRHIKDNRGMKFFYDVIDWVGGYPFEVAKPVEVIGAFESRGFKLKWSKTVGFRLGCNEFIFEKTAD